MKMVCEISQRNPYISSGFADFTGLLIYIDRLQGTFTCMRSKLLFFMTAIEPNLKITNQHFRNISNFFFLLRILLTICIPVGILVYGLYVYYRYYRF